MNGIEKEVDLLGRVVIPAKFREKLGIGLKTKVIVSMEGNGVIIMPQKQQCALCENKIETESKYRLCRRCLMAIKTDNDIH